MAIFHKSAARAAKGDALSSSPSDSRAETRTNENARLHVGRDLRLQGSVENCDILIIEGYMKASNVRSKKVTVAETGVLEGEVSADNVEVHGRFKGTMLARVFLDVRATGEVDGEISYGALAVAQGGRLCGHVRRADSVQDSVQAAEVFVPKAS